MIKLTVIYVCVPFKSSIFGCFFHLCLALMVVMAGSENLILFVISCSFACNFDSLIAGFLFLHSFLFQVLVWFGSDPPSPSPSPGSSPACWPIPHHHPPLTWTSFFPLPLIQTNPTHTLQWSGSASVVQWHCIFDLSHGVNACAWV